MFGEYRRATYFAQYIIIEQPPEQSKMPVVFLSVRGRRVQRVYGLSRMYND